MSRQSHPLACIYSLFPDSWLRLWCICVHSALWKKLQLPISCKLLFWSSFICIGIGTYDLFQKPASAFFSQVEIHYYARLAAKQGWRFDSTYDHKDGTGAPVPYVFTIGSGTVRWNSFTLFACVFLYFGALSYYCSTKMDTWLLH